MANGAVLSICERCQYVRVSWPNWKAPGDTCHNLAVLGCCELSTCGMTRRVYFLKSCHKPSKDTRGECGL